MEASLAGNGGHGDRLRSTQVSRGKGESECERELGLDEVGNKARARLHQVTRDGEVANGRSTEEPRGVSSL